MPVEHRLLLLALLAPLLIGAAPRVAAAEPGWIADPVSGCRAWDPFPVPDESIRWSGSCRDGIADGEGTLSWYGKDKTKVVESASGQFRRGRLSGHGVEITGSGTYKGQWDDGRRNGRGTMIWDNGDRYTGSWREGERNGFGTALLHNGDRYIGGWRDGKRSGYGIVVWKSGGRYDGQWADDALDGFGTRVWQDGAVYRGQWARASRSGKGTLLLPGGGVIDGEWKEDRLNGPCVVRARDGSRYQGTCRGFGPEGRGTKAWPNGDRYEGEWQAGQRSGQGLFTTAAGERYDGEWRFDKQDGTGRLIRADGSRYEGEMLAGVPQGWGRETASDGRIREGYWAGRQFLGAGWFARTGQADQAWPQERSDIQADPAVLFGRLPNGMRYAILRNETPKDQVAFRFRIDAGSIDEKPAQRGLAHFLEHMAFRGSARIADGEAFRMLERLGGQVGADTNAFTTQTQTSYHLNLPHGDPASLGAALTLLRETASELSLTPEAVASERAVVIAEARLFDTPAQHELSRQMGFLYRGQPIGDHLPIGSMTLLERFTADDLKRFYRAYYRPERATLIVVGAIDPRKIESEIRARFSDWRGQGEPGPEPDRQPPGRRGPDLSTHTEPQTPGVLFAAWVAPFDGDRDDRSREAAGIARALALGVVNRAYLDAAQSGKVPFTSAGLAFTRISRSADVSQLSIGLSNLNDWRHGAGAVFGMLRRILADGVSRADLDRQVAIFRTAYDQMVEGAATRQTRDLADGLLNSVDSGVVFRTPATDKAIFEEAVAALTPAKATEALRDMVGGGGPLFFVGAGKLPGDLAGLPALWTNSAPPAAAPAATATAAWPYQRIGEPGKVTARSADPGLGVTRIAFENGVGLVVRPSKASAGEVLVEAHFDLPVWNRPSYSAPPFWSCSPLILGGVRKLPYPDLVDFLDRIGTAINCQAGPAGVDLSMATQPAHLDDALQALAAYIGDPAWRPEAMIQTRNRFATIATQYDSTLEGRLERDSPVLLHDGDARWRCLPLPAEPATMTLEQAKSYLGPALSDSPLSVVVAGDVDAERAGRAVAATLGALPRRKGGRIDPPAPGTVKFPAHNASPQVLRGPRIQDQALAFEAWPTRDAMGDLDTVYNLEIASAVLQRRLFDKFRTELGAAYTPSADQRGDLDLPGSGFFYVDAVTPPDKLSLFYRTVNAILDDLRVHEIGSDEFERARKPLLDSQIKAEQSNAYWLSWLIGPTREAYARSRAAGLRRATPKAVRAAIRAYLLDATAWKMEIRPDQS